MTERGLADVHEDGETCIDPECPAPHFRGYKADHLFSVRKAWERGACGHATKCRTVIVPECVLWRDGQIPDWLGPLLTPATPKTWEERGGACNWCRNPDVGDPCKFCGRGVGDVVPEPRRCDATRRGDCYVAGCVLHGTPSPAPLLRRPTPPSSPARSFSLGETVMYLREDLGGKAAIPCEVSALFPSIGAVQIRMVGVNLEQPRFFTIVREQLHLLLSRDEFRALLAGTTTPARSVPSEQWGNLALNFCSPVHLWTWKQNAACSLVMGTARSVAKMHPCSFATLKI